MAAHKKPREPRKCICGCGEIFYVLSSSSRRYAPTCKTIRNPSVSLRSDVVEKISASKRGKLNPNWKQKEIRVCACGCKETFECLPSSRRQFLSVSHSKRGDNNPMRDKLVAAKVNRSGVPRPKSKKGLENISSAARKRMLSSDNPFWNEDNASKWLRSQHPTMTQSETEFLLLFGDKFNLRFTGNGDLWIGGKCPDFAIIGTSIVIEVSRPILHRNAETYTVPRTIHYSKYGYQCVVIWAHDKPPFFKDVPVEEILLSALRQSPTTHQQEPNLS